MSKSIVVADDSVTIQKSIAITFAQEDFKVTYSNNGDEALVKAQTIQPDMIIADVSMPGKTGFEVCKTIKNDPNLKDTKVLLLAGGQEELNENQIQSIGADGYIIKPFESQNFIDKVHQVLDAPPSGSTHVPSGVEDSFPFSADDGAPANSNIENDLDFNIQLDQGESNAQPAAQEDDFSFDLGIDQNAPADNGIEKTEPLPKDMAFQSEPLVEKNNAPAQAQSQSVSDDNLWDFGSEFQDKSSTPEPADPQPSPEIPYQGSENSHPEESFSFDSPAESLMDSNPTDELGISEEPRLDSSSFEPAGETAIDFGSEPASQPVQPIEEANSIEPDLTEPIDKSFGSDFSDTPDSNTPLDSGLSATQNSNMPVDPASVQLSEQQIESIVTKVFQKVIEQIAWEVVPDMAEKIIREEINRLTRD